MDIAQDHDISKCININVSTQFLNVATKFFHSYNNRIKDKNINSILNVAVDNIVKVSPYKICN
jgi:hypothetical protein